MAPDHPDRSAHFPQEEAKPAPTTRSAEGTWDERLCDAAVTGFALWTLCCHALVLGGPAPGSPAGGGSLRQLIALFTVVLLFFLALRRRSRRRMRRRESEADRAPCLESFELPPALRWGLVTAGVAAALALSRPPSFVALWYAVAAVLVVAAAWLFFRPGEVRESEPPSQDRRSARLLLVLALASASLALVAQKSNADDAFYVSLTVAALEAPSSPMLAGDPMHGVEGLPLYISIYRVHSYEMLAAAVAYLAGLPPIAVFHLLGAALVAFLLPLAHAALFRRLLPGHWLLATGLLTIVLIGPGDAVRWYGQFAYLRPWQGKSAFLCVLTPLLYVYAMRFAGRPTPSAWLRLAGAQVAAVGLTSSALWAAPVAVAFGLVVGLRRAFSSLRTLLLGLASSGYLVLLGLALKSSVAGSVKTPPTLSPDERIAEVLEMILGVESPRLWTLAAVAVAVAWALVPPGPARRFALLIPLGSWLIFLNPHLGDWLMANVTHRPHWRAMWTLPLPVLITLLLLAPLHLFPRSAASSAGKLPRRAICVALAVLVAVFIPRVHNLSAENEVRFGLPAPTPTGLKVPPRDYAAARAINRAYAPGTLIAAPPEINVWLPTFHPRTRPLFVRFYLRRLGAHLGEEELRRRDFIPRLVRGDTDWQGAPEALRRELAAFREIEGVALPASRQRDAYREVLESLDFERLPSAEAEALDLDLWRREATRNH